MEPMGGGSRWGERGAGSNPTVGKSEQDHARLRQAQREVGRDVPPGLPHREGAQRDNKEKEERSEASSTDMTAIASRSAGLVR